MINLDFAGGSVVKICVPLQETWVQFLGQEDPHSSIVAWRILRTEEPGRVAKSRT